MPSSASDSQHCGEARSELASNCGHELASILHPLTWSNED